MFYDSPAPDPLVLWAVGSDLQWQAVCVVWMGYDDNHYSTSELPAARVHKTQHRMALQLCALRVTFQTPVVLVFGYDPEIAIHLLP